MTFDFVGFDGFLLAEPLFCGEFRRQEFELEIGILL